MAQRIDVYSFGGVCAAVVLFEPGEFRVCGRWLQNFAMENAR